MPPDFFWQELGFLEKFLLVVFSEVEELVGRGMEGEDVGRRLEFGDRNQPDCVVIRRRGRGYTRQDGGDVG